METRVLEFQIMWYVRIHRMMYAGRKLLTWTKSIYGSSLKFLLFYEKDRSKKECELLKGTF